MRPLSCLAKSSRRASTNCVGKLPQTSLPLHTQWSSTCAGWVRVCAQCVGVGVCVRAWVSGWESQINIFFFLTSRHSINKRNVGKQKMTRESGFRRSSKPNSVCQPRSATPKVQPPSLPLPLSPHPPAHPTHPHSPQGPFPILVCWTSPSSSPD